MIKREHVDITLSAIYNRCSSSYVMNRPELPHIGCMVRHMQACLTVKQFQYILNVTEYVNENYLRVEEKILKAIDYVKNTNVEEVLPTGSPSQWKQSTGTQIMAGLISQEEKYLVQLLNKLANWNPSNDTTSRTNRFIPLFALLGAAIGSLLNAGQIKKIKENIAILQDATILQGLKIAELARYADLTAARVRLHDSQINGLQYKMLIVEDGIKEMIDVSNFQVYTSYHITITQTILARLQTGTVSIERFSST